MLRDHPGVLREQSIASDQSRPGDISFMAINFDLIVIYASEDSRKKNR